MCDQNKYNPLFSSLKEMADHYKCSVDALSVRLGTETLSEITFKVSSEKVTIDNSYGSYPLHFPFTKNRFDEALCYQEQEEVNNGDFWDKF